MSAEDVLADVKLSGKVHLANQLLGDAGAVKLADQLRQNTEPVTSLHLGNCGIRSEGAKALAAVMVDMEGLQHVYLGNNKIEDEGALELRDAVEGCETITRFKLAGNPTSLTIQKEIEMILADRARNDDSDDDESSDEEDVIPLEEVMMRLVSGDEALVEINLTNTAVGNEGAEALAEALEDNEVVRKVMLGNCSIGDKGAEALAEAIMQHATVTHVSLANNRIKDRGARALLELAKSNAKLVRLNVVCNPMSFALSQQIEQAVKRSSATTQAFDEEEIYKGGVSEEGVELDEIREALESGENVPTINLTNQPLGDRGATELAELVRDREGVRDLLLANCNIGDEGAEELAYMLVSHPSVVHVNLTRNNIDDDGGQKLLQAVQQNERLTRVRMTGNTLSFEMTREFEELEAARRKTFGVDKVITQVYQNDELMKTLEMTGIGNTGAISLAAALAGNTHITHLALASCKIGDKGMKALANALAANEAVEQLYLGNNRIRDAGGRALLDALKDNPRITKVSVAGNPMSYALQKEIETLMKARKDNGAGGGGDGAGGGGPRKLAAFNAPRMKKSSSQILNTPTKGKKKKKAKSASKTSKSTRSLGHKRSESIESMESLKSTGSSNDDDLERAVAQFENYSTSKAKKERGTKHTKHVKKRAELEEEMERDVDNFVRRGSASSRFASDEPLLEGMKKEHETLLRAVACNSKRTQVVDLKKLGNAGAELLAEALAHNTHVTYVSIANCKLTDDGIIPLAKVLETNNTVLNLFLGNNKITDEGGEVLLEALQKNTSVKKVSVAGNKMSVKLQQAIENAVKYQHGGLGARRPSYDLTARAERLAKKASGGVDKKKKASEAIMSLDTVVSLMYENDKSLKKVTLTNIGDRGAASLAYALEKNDRVTSLSLAGCKIGDKGARALAAALCLNTSVKYLYLANNRIGDAGANALLQMLREDNTTIKKISLAANSISYSMQCEVEEEVSMRNAAAGIEMSESEVSYTMQLDQTINMLAENEPKLRKVTLTGIPIHENEAMDLADALSSNTRVKELHLGGCKLSDAATGLLCEGFANCHSLTHLYLANNKIGAEGAAALLEAVVSNKKISKISLAGNPCPVGIQQEIEDLVKSRRGKTAKEIKAAEA